MCSVSDAFALLRIRKHVKFHLASLFKFNDANVDLNSIEWDKSTINGSILLLINQSKNNVIVVFMMCKGLAKR